MRNIISKAALTLLCMVGAMTQAPAQTAQGYTSGDISNVTFASDLVTVYTDGLVGGYCRITQIDPAG